MEFYIEEEDEYGFSSLSIDEFSSSNIVPDFHVLSIEDSGGVTSPSAILLSTPMNLSYIPESKLEINKYGQNIIKNINNDRSNIFILLPFIEQTTNEPTSYTKQYPAYIYWIQITNTSQTLQSSVILKHLNNGYKELFTNYALFPCDKSLPNISNYLQKNRSENQLSQSIFHFIAYDTTFINDDSINIKTQTNGENHKIPILDIFKALDNNFVAIFDGAKSGVALNVFNKFEKIKSEKLNSNAKDYYLLCSCSQNEEMPKNPYLPRDFLTCVLLSPIKMLILCFIINYYPDKLKSSEFDPMEDINPEVSDYFMKIIIAITETIAYECLPRELFLKLFRSDESIAKIFQRFIIAQYLLNFFNLHPISYPTVPQLENHQAWKYLHFVVEKYIITDKKIKFQNENDIFQSVIQSFFKNINSSSIDKTVISICSLIPFIFPNSYELFAPLSYYASLSPKNRDEVIGVINFKKLFSLIFKQLPSSLYHSVVYLIMTSLISSNTKYSLSVAEQPDLQFLVDKIMDKKVSTSTRAILTAITTRIVDSYQVAHNFFITENIFKRFCSQINDAEPQLLFWLFILMKQVFKHFSIDQVNFIEQKTHLQVASFSFHNSYEIRAATIAFISNFMQSGYSVLNHHLFLILLPLSTDVNYLVRHQLLLLIIRFLASTRLEFNARTYEYLPNSSFSQHFEAILHSNFRNIHDFSVLQNISARVASMQSSESKLIKSSLYLLNYFIDDPSKLVKELATKALDLFKKHDRREVAPSFNSSSQNLSTIQMRADIASENFDIPDDFGVLYSHACAQLVKSEQWNPEIYDKKNQQETTVNDDNLYMPSELILKENEQVGDRHIERIEFVGDKIVVQTAPKMISILDTELSARQSFIFKSPISCLSSLSNSIVASATDEGSIHLYDISENAVLTSFRSSVEKCSQIIDCYKYRISTAGTTISGVRLFDINTQKFAGEWATPENSFLTSLKYFDENLCICGMNEGYIIPIDFRVNQTHTVVPIGVNEDIVKIAGIGSNKNQVFAVSVSGKIYSIDLRNLSVSLISERKGLCSSFISVPSFPVLFYSSSQEKPIMMTPSGQIICEIDSFKNSMMSASYNDNLVSFADPRGNIQLFEILK